jgi:hypothetical protein
MAVGSSSSGDERSATREAFDRYARMLGGTLGPAAGAGMAYLAEADERAAAVRVQVERGILFPRLLLDPAAAADADAVEPAERLIALAAAPETLQWVVVVDRLGHQRPAYRPLLVYCWLQAYRAGYETLPRDQFGRWEEASRAWCDDLERRLGEFAWPDGAIAASRGAAVAEVCWTALALHVAGKVFIRDAWTDLAGDVFGRLLKRQRPGGAFLEAGSSDNPETWWFAELAILHAAASYAVQAEDRALAAAVARAGEMHLAQTQPDHATNQPWGLFAFIWNPKTRGLADQVLHAAEVNLRSEISDSRSQGSGITLMLMADALYCLRLFGT